MHAALAGAQLFLEKTAGGLDFLSDQPVKGLPGEITPHQFMLKHLEPQLQCRENERDLVLIRDTVSGSRDGVRTKLTFDLVDRRDHEIQLFAVNRTVGYTASIVAQMMVKGEIGDYRTMVTASGFMVFRPSS